MQAGAVLARAEAGYPLADAPAGLGRAGPRGLVAGHRGGARRSCERRPAPPAGIGLSGQMHGLVALDGADRVLRPAILWNDQRTGRPVRRDRADGRARAADRADRQPRAARLHRTEAAVAARARARRLGAHRADDAAQGLRAPAAVRRARDRRLGRVRDAAARCRARAAGAPRCSSALELDPALAARGAREPGGVGHTRATGSRSRPAPATRPPARSASASTGPGPLSVVLGTSGVVFAALRAVRRRPARPRVHAFCHAVPDAWHVMGVMLSAAGSLGWAARHAGPGDRATTQLLAGADGWPPGVEGLTVPALSGRRAHAPRRPRRPRRVRRPERSATTAARSCGPCSRASPSACATRLDLIAELGVPATRSAACPAAAPAASCGWDRRLGAGAAARARRRRRGRRVRRRAARRGRGRRVRRRRRRRSRRPSRPGRRIEPVAEWVEPYREARERFRALYPALRSAGERPDPGAR